MKTKRPNQAISLIALLICMFFQQFPVRASEAGKLPLFSDFVASVSDGEEGVVRGVYVPDVLAFPILQQPPNDSTVVIARDGVLTQFHAAALNNVIGLLAHNNLAGAAFAGLQVGQEVRVVYGDGMVDYYMITQIARFKADEPENPYSTFQDWKAEITYTAQDIFNMFYTGENHVTFQTCIAQDGNASWGRLFIVAYPVAANYFSRPTVNLTMPKPVHKKILINTSAKKVQSR